MISKIEQYLQSEGINALNDSELENKIIQTYGNEKAKEIIKSWKKGEPITEDPKYYDLFQASSIFYELRKRFLLKMTDIIDSYGNDKKLIITEGGCATGIDICFLAAHYNHSGLSFRAYDSSLEMVRLAQARKKRLGLSSLEVYYGDHFNLREEENEASDIIFTKIGVDNPVISPQEQARNIISLCKKLIPGGIYIQGAVTVPLKDEAKKILQNNYIFLKKTQHVMSVSYRQTEIYNRIFKKI